ncbi:MAG: ATPase, T2SS/T4P/T4SS family [Candidatus Burarchaeum sp.]|nr:ATPase, T2SS/T4P/T4SS family [Candidatus Burarchaeum sp.]MDO8340163.1 ATPase, T2SS/T4P/T4SS family [Candidatus Burarchaeum sp.]
MPEESIVGNKIVVDCSASPYELFSPEFINNHLKALTTLLNDKIRGIRYEEEIVIEFDEEKTQILREYINVIRELEVLSLKPETFGRPDDDGYPKRKKLFHHVYEELFQSPILALSSLADYVEPVPERGIFIDSYKRFMLYRQDAMEAIKKTQFYLLVQKCGDARQVFISFAGLRSFKFVQSLVLDLPKNAKLVDSPNSAYGLEFGIMTKVYDMPGSEVRLYVHENPLIDALDDRLQKLLKEEIVRGMEESEHIETLNYELLYEEKTREYRRHFLDQASLQGIVLTEEQAQAMAHEAASWSVGLGAPIENMSLDQKNITDIYIDSENSPIYIEHAKFGLCHTLWRYNRDILEHVAKNIMAVTKEVRRFDEKNPIADVFLTRLNMRCHMQGPPATFGEIQLALRLMKRTPFTYAQYVDNYSMSAFSAGYDDLMVSLGCSEAVLGTKGVGKTSFTAAKIISIGSKKRILPIQDIEEIPTKAYRKRGFHIGTMRVQSSDLETGSQKELSLIAMASAALRMGEACLVINEIRSRLAVQGIINLLNTQPGIFVLYNFHAQSMRDVQDRLELVFGVPAASMFATDRYSFLRKIRFGRKGPLYRIFAKCYESDIEEHKFVDIFTLKRGISIEKSTIACNFLDMPEANAWSLAGVSIGAIAKKLKLKYIPPALQRRSDETGISPEQYILQAFFKGRVYSDMVTAAREKNNELLMEMDFVLKCSAVSNKLLRDYEDADGSVDYSKIDAAWESEFKKLVAEETA